jgi:hypothetical protein
MTLMPQSILVSAYDTKPKGFVYFKSPFHFDRETTPLMAVFQRWFLYMPFVALYWFG